MRSIMRYAVIEDGKVANVVEWDGRIHENTPTGYLVRSDVAEVGDAYDMDTGVFPSHVVTPAPEVLVTETNTTPIEPELETAADATIDEVEEAKPDA